MLELIPLFEYRVKIKKLTLITKVNHLIYSLPLDMRARSVKHLVKNCLRISFKQNCHICSILLLILNVTIWLFVFLTSERVDCSLSNCSRRSFSDDLLDECMLESTPCHPDIEMALDRYFPKVKNRFSMLLTYHPRIDCDHGRYLLLNDALSSHIYHGTGSQLMWYLGVLNVAYALNLTLIHLPWTAEHIGDETNFDREKYWQFSDWEIPYSAYQSCPNNSAIKRNVFRYNLTANQTFDQHHHGKEPFTIKSHFQSLFQQFLRTLTDKNTGFTFYSAQTITITSSLMEVGVVLETRWWLQHRELYLEHNGVWSGLPILSNYHPVDYFQYIKSNQTTQPTECPAIDAQSSLLIGVHIRQGDVVKRNQHNRIISADLYRYMSNSAYIPLLILIINSLPLHIKENYLITIYSEGDVTNFLDILVALKKALPDSRCRLSFFLNGRTSETFNRLLRDDMVIGTFSTFSMATGIFNSRQLKIGPLHNRGRVHGMRNHLSLAVNRNHTLFHLTEKIQSLIERRIPYVYKQKQAQQSTPRPLWLDNYADDYPDEFMLI